MFFVVLVCGFENSPEGGSRCEKCIYLRMKKTAEKAMQLNFDLFATTLSVSPHKNAKMINEIGKSLQEEYGINYLESDFKKKEGYLKSIQLSKEFGLYRQKYCGCKYSIYDESLLNN